MKELPVTSPAEPLLAVNDQMPAQEDFFRETNQLPTFEKIVIRPVVGVGRAIPHPAFRIPDHEIGI